MIQISLYSFKCHLIQCLILFQVDKHPELNATLKVTVKIEDVDDKNPKFKQIHYTANISENVIIFDEVTFKNLKKEFHIVSVIKSYNSQCIRMITVYLYRHKNIKYFFF